MAQRTGTHAQKRRRSLWTGAVAVTALCAQYTTELMASVKPASAQWNEQETAAVVDYLLEHHAEGGDGGNYKMSVFNSAAHSIAPLLTKGPTKTGAMVKTKWATLKQTYQAIETYRNLSGCHWDDVHGAGIEGDAAADVWKTYTMSKPLLRSFHNKGWPYYAKIQSILPMAAPRGSRAFHPTTASPVGPSDDNPSKETSHPSIEGDEAHEPKDTASTSALLTPPPLSAVGSSKHKLGTMLEADPSLPSIATSSLVSDVSTESKPSKKSQRSSRKGGIVGSSGAAMKPSRITPATAVYGMQGSINRLTDAVEKSIIGGMEDPQDARRVKAIEMIEEMDCGLSMDQKIAITSLFTDNTAAATTFVTLKNEDFRRGWIMNYLEKQV